MNISGVVLPLTISILLLQRGHSTVMCPYVILRPSRPIGFHFHCICRRMVIHSPVSTGLPVTIVLFYACKGRMVMVLTLKFSGVKPADYTEIMIVTLIRVGWEKVSKWFGEAEVPLFDFP
jgi:hypothetical protein